MTDEREEVAGGNGAQEPGQAQEQPAPEPIMGPDGERVLGVITGTPTQDGHGMKIQIRPGPGMPGDAGFFIVIAEVAIKNAGSAWQREQATKPRIEVPRLVLPPGIRGNRGKGRGR